MIRIKLPYHLQTLAGIEAKVLLAIPATPTAAEVIRALELAHPNLRGAIIDSTTDKHRAKVRFFACQKDAVHQEMTDLLPQDVINGREPLLIVGAFLQVSKFTRPTIALAL
jgi:molybdopterin synthase sulfur carrier subunit